YSRAFQQHTNYQPFFDYNNTNNNNYQQNSYQPQQNIYPQQPPPQLQPDYNRQYANPPKKKTSTGMYIMLIAVIVFFAVIIVAMSTIMKAMVNKKNNDNYNSRGNTTLSDSAENDEDSENETEASEETPNTTMPVVAEEVTEVTAPAIETEPEIVTVTVIVEVPVEPEPEHYDPPVKNQTYVYDTGFYGYITTQKDPLNVRSEPSKNSKVLTSIPKGEYVYVYNTSEYGWYYTTYNGNSGYISADYVTAGQSPVYDSYTPSTAVVATKQDVLNLRKSASTNGTIITGIPKGSTVTIIEYGYDWCYVSWVGYTGYVSTDYLTF
ncbi:MAG: SH3 domain-containing protein, partial [Ruminococcus sp.]|nr:SH3 domain-containing protein [Ruminococcus sp.]